METETVAGAAREAFEERLGPALKALEDDIQHLRDAVARACGLAEDAVAGAARRVQEHPVGALAAAAGAALIAGALVGYRFGRAGRAPS
jgi:ElaB/YqjD/DUF883 family membrane-anchored ribosome-binding protein